VQVFEVLSRVVQDLPEQLEFCKNNGIAHLNNILVKRERLNADGVRAFFAAYLRSISWIANKDLTEEMSALKTRLFTSGELRPLTGVVEFLDICHDHKGVLEAVFNMMNFMGSCQSNYAHLIMLPPAGTRGILDVEASRRNRTNYAQISDDAVRIKHVQLLLDYSKKYLVEDKIDVVAKAVQLIVYCAFEALVLPHSTLQPVITTLENIATSPALLGLSSAVSASIGKVLLAEPLFAAFMLELVIHRYKDLNQEGSYLLVFFNKFYSKVPEIGSNKIFNETLSTLSRQLVGLHGKLHTQVWSPEFQKETVADLILLFSVLSTIFAQSPSKQTYIAPFHKEIKEITTLISTSLAAPSTSTTTPNLSSVDKKTLESLLSLVKSVANE